MSGKNYRYKYLVQMSVKNTKTSVSMGGKRKLCLVGGDLFLGLWAGKKRKNGFLTHFTIFKMEFLASPILAAFEQQRRHEEENNASEQNVEDNDVNIKEEKNSSKKKVERRAQQVSTLAMRLRVMKWMINIVASNGEVKLISQTVDQFPDLFRVSRNANIQKCARW
jgi:hypothetical protein